MIVCIWHVRFESISRSVTSNVSLITQRALPMIVHREQSFLFHHRSLTRRNVTLAHTRNFKRHVVYVSNYLMTLVRVGWLRIYLYPRHGRFRLILFRFSLALSHIHAHTHTHIYIFCSILAYSYEDSHSDVEESRATHYFHLIYHK